MGAIFSAEVTKMVDSWCNASLYFPWKSWFSFILFWIARDSVVAIRDAISIGVSFSKVQCCG